MYSVCDFFVDATALMRETHQEAVELQKPSEIAWLQQLHMLHIDSNH